MNEAVVLAIPETKGEMFKQKTTHPVAYFCHAHNKSSSQTNFRTHVTYFLLGGFLP
jgi:hypothetical protein